ncbi:MAG: hypothetical protein H5U24_06160 [Thioclava marina]|jgi:hypothetical protein|uniref:PH domain-containing protein n=1 Tax=Thioclava marina TaxID=1915077 RepID=A0ABX3MIZ8_9RHOB|nr:MULTISPECIES: hypothetical protein [Thioclava]TNE90140.1 MAG: hypothetical protein EP337_08035 [Paracoccaceae bacterium]MBC7144974.1 hypothetical protein [Thioclava marina]MBD3802803.1 hypothetical protein [Thioclava sp.]OOY11517.1 hypothetical protein BMG00_10405 [Thioclava marina]OOY27346.1 hypothetical protein BMI90_12070 [Thioclava sp. L04-15]
MDDIPFEYRKQARRAGGYLALGLGMGLLYFAAQIGAQNWIHALIWTFLLITLWRLLRNRSGALRITQARMEVFRNGRQLGSFPLRQIAAAQIRKRRFGGLECLIFLSDGRHAYLPPEAIPSAERLSAELSARGVEVS